MQQQQTLREKVEFTGIGLHSGNPVHMTFLPAEPNTGIRFRRVDLDGKPEIGADIDHVVDTNRSTTLGKGNTRHLRDAARNQSSTAVVPQSQTRNHTGGDGHDVFQSTAKLDPHHVG